MPAGESVNATYPRDPARSIGEDPIQASGVIGT